MFARSITVSTNRCWASLILIQRFNSFEVGGARRNTGQTGHPQDPSSKEGQFRNPSDFAVIFVGRPRQGTIMRWKRAGSTVENAVERKQPIPSLGDLSPDQQETMCSEFLRSGSTEKLGLSRLAHLLLPVGRTMKGIDICGITTSGHTLFAQVTYRGIEDCQEKIDKLLAYRDSGRNILFSCNCKE